MAGGVCRIIHKLNINSKRACNSFFDNEKETFVYCDASPVCVSSILLQSSTKEHTNANVIAYASRSLSPTEERYSQIERECLGLVHACERNHIYLFGRQVTVYTDHKALVQLINNPNKALPLRLERMVLKLQKYNFHIKHVRGIDNIADFTSRHPCYTKISKDNKTEQYVHFVTQHAIPTALTLEDIKRETLRDNCLLKVIQIINTGEWYKVEDQNFIKNLTKPEADNLKQFQRIKDELTLNTDQDILLKQNRIVIPQAYSRKTRTYRTSGHS